MNIDLVENQYTKTMTTSYFFCSGCMDKQVLSSVRASEETSKYVAGVFKEGTFISFHRQLKLY